MISKEKAERNVERLVKSINKEHKYCEIDLSKAKSHLNHYLEIANNLKKKGHEIFNVKQGYYLETPDSMNFWQQAIGIINMSKDSFNKISQEDKTYEHGENLLHRFDNDAIYDRCGKNIIIQPKESNKIKRILKEMIFAEKYQKYFPDVESTKIL